MDEIVIKGARENNLKNIDITIPRNKVVCFVGVSGSGKSTIAFDIIAKEGQRQYFESLNAYARRYLAKNNRPDVEEIKGISSTIIIDQDRVRNNPRSTVGTITESYTYLRLLYSRVGLPSMDSSYYSFNHPYGFCKKCKGLGRTVEVNLHKILYFNKSLNEGALIPPEWYVGGRQWSIIKASKYFDLDKKIKDYSQEELNKLLYASPQMLEAHSGELVDRFTFQGMVYRIMHRNTKVHRGPSEGDLKYFDFVPCPECQGWRLNKKALNVRINGLNIGEVANMPIVNVPEFINSVNHINAIAIKPKLIEQLEALIKVGVGYLSLNRSADTLSGGEAQRVKMARQMGCNLIETIYVLDEPTAGLHPRDTENVINNLRRLQQNGNTVLVVEHDMEVIKSADYVIEVGPGGGKNGGTIVSQGRLCLKEPLRELKGKRLPSGFIKIVNASKHNLKNINVSVPTGVLVALTGVSGSGKSSLVEEIISSQKIVLVSQDQIGQTKRGCIATYVGAFDCMRKVFAKVNKVSDSLFSFNGKGGCMECRGVGILDMDMNFLGNVKIKCEACHGQRYKKEVLKYLYKGKNIVDVLKMTAEEVKDFFDEPEIKRRMNLLMDVGLDYVEMGQTLDTLSGGESQRLKLASRLQNRGEFYILDEPTSGLHFADVEKLLALLNRLVDHGNTVLVVEHNLDVIKNADWVVDLGPEGGEKGGYIVAEGTPKDICRVEKSYTGQYLKKMYE